jgi:hypothetical protein
MVLIAIVATLIAKGLEVAPVESFKPYQVLRIALDATTQRGHHDSDRIPRHRSFAG